MARDGICPVAVNADDWAQRLVIRGGGGNVQGHKKRKEKEVYIQRLTAVDMDLFTVAMHLINDQNVDE